MQISLKDFRCFHLAQDIEVRPINILVGENNAGKSSLLAAVRFLHDLFREDAKASFNKDPFYLGAYEQIAHYRGGRFGRAKEFSFSLRDLIDKEFIVRRSRMLERQRLSSPLPDQFELSVTFVNNRSQPAISRVCFEAGKYRFELEPRDPISMFVQTPRVLRLKVPSRSLRWIAEPFVYDLSYLDFALRDARFFLLRQAKGIPTNVADEVMVLGDLYRSVTRALPREAYASAPVRSKPERTYNPGESIPSPGGEHIPFVLSQIKAFDKELWADVVRTLSSFGKASGLFEAIDIKRLSNTESGPFQLIVGTSKNSSRQVAANLTR
jgi:AAA domain